MCLVIGKLQFTTANVHVVTRDVENECTILLLCFGYCSLQRRKRLEIVSRCVSQGSGGIGQVLCGFHFQPLPYCAFVETKGRARGGPPCHLGVYLSKLCHARYTYIACSIRLLAPLDFSHDWSFVNIVDLFFFFRIIM